MAVKVLLCSQGPGLTGECLNFEGISSQWHWLWEQQGGDQSPDTPAHLTQWWAQNTCLFASPAHSLLSSSPVDLLSTGPFFLLSSISGHYTVSLMSHKIFCRLLLPSSTLDPMLRVQCPGDPFILINTIQLEKCLISTIAKFYLSEIK